MAARLPGDALVRPPVLVEIAHESVLGLRRVARLRETTVERLAKEILSVLGEEEPSLIDAILDEDARPPSP